MKLTVHAVAVAGTAWLVACGASQDQSLGGPLPGGDDASTPDASVGDDSGRFGDVISGPCSTCSADLRTVLDCQGHVVQTCPPDQGCSSGQCIPACAAAAADKSTLGCDYYSIIRGSLAADTGDCYAVWVANTWDTAITINAEFNGKPLDLSGAARIPSGQGANLTYAPLPNGQLPAGQLAILFLAGNPSLVPYNLVACPQGVTPAYTAADAWATGTQIFHAFHITTSAPVVVADEFPYGGYASFDLSASLLIPTPAWGTNYIAVDGFSQGAYVTREGQPWVQILAQQNDTHVTISPTANIVGGTGVAPATKGQPQTYTLQTDEVLQLRQDTELIGSPILADKPIGVWAGSSCMYIPNDCAACDGAHQQLPPVPSLGHEYVAARYRNRIAGPDEAPPWRIVGAVDGTTLTYDPAPPAGAPATIDSGQLAQFDAAGPFVVRSQDDKHPFYISGHMTGGGSCISASEPTYGTGDPETVNVVPPQLYLKKYIFMTDPTLSNTNLVVVRTKASDGTFKDVSLDCAGTLSGWSPIGSGGQYELSRVDLVVAKQGVNGCGNGLHEMHSDAPFGLTVWGWDSVISYAYPAGQSVQPINSVVVPPLPK
jgi:hypothetical protein